MKTPTLAEAILKLAHVHDKRLEAVATALDGIACQIKYLGNGDACTQMGAVEGLGVVIKEGLENLSGLELAGRDIAGALERLAEVKLAEFRAQ